MRLYRKSAFILMLCIYSSFAYSDQKHSTHIASSKVETGLINDPIHQHFQDTVSASSVPINKPVLSPVRIALIYPSADISDFWTRNYTALTRRLDELNIPYDITEFSSRQIQHAVQTKYTNIVLNTEESFDFVIFGPSELQVQSQNIKKLASSDQFKTLIWAFHTPDRSWNHLPDAWFDFSSSMGAKALCHYLINDLGEDVYFALNRGIPGITDTQRSLDFADCVEKEGNWISMYDHFGQYQKAGGQDGARLVAKNFPEVTMLHNANTAMTMGAIEGLRETGKLDSVFVTGWGGTAKEIAKVRQGELNATPMRMSDDVGVATAEAIKYYLEGRDADVPEIYLGRITVVSSKMSADKIDKLTQEAFRYSGD